MINDPDWYIELYDVCYEYGVEDLKKFLAENPHVDLSYKTGGLQAASSNNNLPIVRYLLTSNDLSVHANIHAQNESALWCAASKGHIQVFDYLLFSPELKQHAYLHADNDSVFRWALQTYTKDFDDEEEKQRVYEFLKYLILEINFPQSYYTKQYLQEMPAPEIEKLFEIAQDVAIMNKELPVSTQKTTRKKI